jgi:hypothetical protein
MCELKIVITGVVMMRTVKTGCALLRVYGLLLVNST